MSVECVRTRLSLAAMRRKQKQNSNQSEQIIFMCAIEQEKSARYFIRLSFSLFFFFYILSRTDDASDV